MPFRRRFRSGAASIRKRKVELILSNFAGELGTQGTTPNKSGAWLLDPSSLTWPAPGGAINVLPELTLVHTRGILNYQTSLMPSNAEGAFAVGVLVWSMRTAGALDPNEIPDPLSDGVDWVWHVAVGASKNKSGAGQFQAGSTVDGSILHSKGMRKLHQGDGLIGIFSVVSNSAILDWTFAMAAEFQFRVKLP